MNATFPLGFPLPTAFYLVLYVATFAVHHAFMHYVLAGSGVVAWARLFPGPTGRPRMLPRILSDWMPFMLSAAITAGVAPLLFVQIVYPEHFYTANILLSWRWMVLIPVLILAFYLLYAIKSEKLKRFPAVIRLGLPVLAVGCFLFIGFCWTANYFLAAEESSWPEAFATATLPLTARQVVSRMLIWIGAAFVSLGMIASWQLRGKIAGNDMAENDQLQAKQTKKAGFRQLAVGALAGMVVAGVGGTALYTSLAADIQQTLTSAFCLPYLIALAVCLAIQVLFWGMCLWRGAPSLLLLAISTIAWVGGILSAAVIRECLRLTQVDIAQLAETHARSFEIGGFGIFLISAVFCGGLIALCIRVVRKGLHA